MIKELEKQIRDILPDAPEEEIKRRASELESLVLNRLLDLEMATSLMRKSKGRIIKNKK